jgi:DNA-binding IscR family transcriptional regulator
MSGELGVPSRLVQQVLQTLLTARLVMEISGAEPAYAPARPLDNITAHHVLMAMRATPGQELVTRDEPVREEVYGEFARIQEAEKKVASSVTVLALVHRARTRLELSEPQPAEDKLRLKPALVPSIEPAASPDIEVAKKQVAATGAAGGESTPDSPGTAGAGNEVRKEATRTPATAASGESKPARPIQAAQKLAEPVSDAEREFPL